MKGGFIVDACVFSDQLLPNEVRTLVNSDKKKILTAEGTKFHKELVNANREFFRRSAQKGRVEYIQADHVSKKVLQLQELKSRRCKRSSKASPKEALIKSKDFDVIAIGITARASCLITSDDALSEDFPILKEIERNLACKYSNPDWKRINPVALKPSSTPLASIQRHLKAAIYKSTCCECAFLNSKGC